jgi:hypothetical protein
MGVSYLNIESEVRDWFNREYGFKAIKTVLPIGNPDCTHEFDLYEPRKVIGGISTSPWINRTDKKTTNTGGQDRAAAELLWLSIWVGDEMRCHVLTDLEMAGRTFERFRHGNFQHEITIYHCNLGAKRFTEIGILKSSGTPIDE